MVESLEKSVLMDSIVLNCEKREPQRYCCREETFSNAALIFVPLYNKSMYKNRRSWLHLICQHRVVSAGSRSGEIMVFSKILYRSSSIIRTRPCDLQEEL